MFDAKQANAYKLKFGAETWKHILEENVKIGMTKEMCEVSWGKPEKINETITAEKKSEQWVYPDNHFLYFNNYILTAIQ